MTALLTVPQVAERLGIGKSKTWQLIASGDIESVVVGHRSRRVEPAAVDRYLDRLRAASAPQAPAVRPRKGARVVRLAS